MSKKYPSFDSERQSDTRVMPAGSLPPTRSRNSDGSWRYEAYKPNTSDDGRQVREYGKGAQAKK